MKKNIGILVLLPALLLVGCNKKDDPETPAPTSETSELAPTSETSETTPVTETKVNLKDYEDMIFYDYDFDSEYNTGKVLRCGFEEVEYKHRYITNEDFYNELLSYNLFEMQFKIKDGVITRAFNCGDINDPAQYHSEHFETYFTYEVAVEEIEIIELNNRFFEETEHGELIFGEGMIVWVYDDVYYSEDYLKSKGVEFVDYTDVIKESKFLAE